MSPKKNTEPMIACPSCGVLNRIASPFCKDCGDRIYKGGAAPSPENTGREISPGKKAFRSAVNSLLFVVIVAAVGLAFWPYASVSVPVARDPGKQVTHYLALVNQAVENKQELPVGRFSQNNLNAFIGQNNRPDDSFLLGVVLSSPNLELIANEPIGPFNLSTRLAMKPGESAGHLEVSDFWLGHLPLPGFWAKPWTRSLSKRFELELDPALWDHLEIQKVESASVFVKFKP